MSTQRPPRFATWLLHRYLHARHKESLIGDLAQLYAERQSSGWYWRQTIGALALGLLQWLRARGTSLAIASGAAWIMIAIWYVINDALITHSGPVYWSLRRIFDSHSLFIDNRAAALTIIWSIGAVLRTLCFGLSGWIAARLQPKGELLALSIVIATVLLWRVPWMQVRLEGDFILLAYYGSALTGLVSGGLLGRYQNSARALRFRARAPAPCP